MRIGTEEVEHPDAQHLKDSPHTKHLASDLWRELRMESWSEYQRDIVKNSNFMAGTARRKWLKVSAWDQRLKPHIATIRIGQCWRGVWHIRECRWGDGEARLAAPSVLSGCRNVWAYQRLSLSLKWHLKNENTSKTFEWRPSENRIDRYRSLCRW